MPRFSIQARIPAFPLLLFLLIHLLYLCILKRELKCFNFSLFAFLNILWIIGQYLQFFWYLKLSQVTKLHLLSLFLLIQNNPQPMQLHNLLRVILLILNMIPFLIYLLDYTRIKLTITREYSLAVCALLKQLSLRLFQYLQQISWHYYFLLRATISLNCGSLLLHVDLEDFSVFPLFLLLEVTLGELAHVLGLEQLDRQRIKVVFLLLGAQGGQLLFQCGLEVFFHLCQLGLLLFLSLCSSYQQVDLGLSLLHLDY